MINNEFWKMASAGIVDGGTGSGSLLELLMEITDRDKRRRMIDAGALEGHFIWQTYYNAAFGYVVEQNSVSECWACIADRYYNPHIRTDIPARPTGISVTDGVISADAPAEGYTIYVYSWDYVEFEELGTLAEHNDPGTGVYVLATLADGGEGISLPSAYITV